MNVKLNSSFASSSIKLKRLLLIMSYLSLHLSGLALHVNANGMSSTIGLSKNAITTRTSAFETVKGTVTDAEGNPLADVSVLVEGTTNGTTTKADGSFAIDVKRGERLTFSRVGYETITVKPGLGAALNIKMVRVHDIGDEVVVVGFGTQKKVNLTGAVGSITSEALEDRPIPSVGQGLQGLIPNLNISIRNGDPSRTADFNIRGYESINGGSPLILVDGVPMEIDRINPNDIKSISVLKDASASAIYGARAAFGVILVETKTAQSGKTTVQLSTEFSHAKPILKIDPVTDPYEFVIARNKANIRTHGTPSYNDAFVENVRKYSQENGPAWGVNDGELEFYGYNNYKDRLLTDFAPQQKYDLSVSGSSAKASYYASFGMLNKAGYIDNREKNENFKRYNVLMKADFKITDWLSLDEKVVFNAAKNDKPHFYNWDVNINSVARVSPVVPIEFPDLEYYLKPGDRADFAQYIGKYFGYVNFFPYLEDGGRETFTTNDTWLSQGITLTPIKGLKLRGEFSYNTYHREYQDVASKVEIIENNDLETGIIIGNGFSGNDYINNASNYNQYYVLNTFGEYTIQGNSKHFLKGLLGFNQEWGSNSMIRGQANTLITPQITDLNATTGTQQTFGNKDHVALRGAFYRINYIYDDRYLFEASGRYDGTSRFLKETRFGVFPSFSAGWRISEEKFMEGTRSFINNLKLRGSYGTLGNQTILNSNGSQNYYPYISTMGIGTSPYMFAGGSRTPYVSAAGLVSPTLTWEAVVSKNFGIDFTILNRRLDATFDIYTRETKKMLTDIEYPSLLGTDAPKSNAADLKTTGWETSLTWRDKVGQDFRYRATVSLSDWEATITKFDNPTGSLSEYYVGRKIGEIWGYETAGIFQTEEEVTNAADQTQIGANWRPGDIRYADLNGDGKITSGSNTLDDPGDRRIIGNATPRYSFGINLDFHYKNWSLTTFFQGVGKRDVWPSTGSWTWFFPYNAGHVEKYFLTETWTEDNRDAYFPAAHVSSSDKKNLATQSRYLQNGGYMRAKSMTLSYNFQNHLLQKVGVSTMRLYFAGMNLFEITKMRKPLDPENVDNVLTGVDNTGAVEYPLQRIFSFGANISF